MTARAGAALAVFVIIAVALLAGGSIGPLASAAADDGHTGLGTSNQANGGEWHHSPPPAQQEEPVLGVEPVDSSPTEPATGDSAPTTPAPASPAPTIPAPSTPATGDSSPTQPGTGGPDTGQPGPAAGRLGAATGQADPGAVADNPGAGGDKGQDAGGQDPGPSGRARTAPPSGGSKGAEPQTDPNVQPGPEPAPSGRSAVTQPATNGEPGGTVNGSQPDQSGSSTLVGSGTGTLKDGGAGGGVFGSIHSARFGSPSGTGGGTSRTPVGVAAASAAGIPNGTQLAAGNVPGDQSGQSGGAGGSGKPKNNQGNSTDQGPNAVTRTVERLVKVVPDSLKAVLGALAAISILLGFGYLFAALRARRLARQRRELLQEVGLLQTALLPPVPEKLGSLRTSVAYRPADGPGAGGDFYDVLPLAGGRVGFILGDVSGHGRGALARTAFMRYTLRAYLEAGLEPRVALQVAGRVIDDNLGGDFATVLLAVHDPETGSLTYASAGHPAPIVVGPYPHDPVTAGSSPPIGVGVRTGLRQTTVPLVPGSVAALFTDGLIEARTKAGILGRERLAELLDSIRETATARRLIERVAAEANVRSDDMAAVVVAPTGGVTAGLFRTEQLEVSTRELEGPVARRFLEACGFTAEEVENAEHEARALAERFGGVVLHVVFGNRLRLEVLPRNVESIEAASRRVSAGSSQ